MKCEVLQRELAKEDKLLEGELREIVVIVVNSNTRGHDLVAKIQRYYGVTFVLPFQLNVADSHIAEGFKLYTSVNRHIHQWMVDGGDPPELWIRLLTPKVCFVCLCICFYHVILCNSTVA